jgi:regulatory protein
MLPSSEALKLCLGWLRSGDLTEAELRRKLEAKGRPEEEIAAALTAVKARKWQSDERVVERVKEVGTHRLEGKSKIEAKLAQRGLDPEQLGEALSDLDEESEKSRALALLQLRLKASDSPAKAARILASKGFEEEVIRFALESLFPDWESQ